MSRIVSPLFVVLCFVVGTNAGLAHGVGDELVVVESTDAMIEAGVVGRIQPGAVFVVQQVNGDWLWPNLPKPGWIHASAVRRLDTGVIQFTRNIGRDARDAQSYWARGQIHRARRNWPAAIRDFEEVIALAPNSYLGYASRGACRYEQDDFDAAVVDFDRALELDPENVAVRHLRKLVYAARGEWDRALAEMDLVIEQAPKDARGHNGRAWLRATCPQQAYRDGELAIADATRACELTGHLNFKCLGTLAAAHAEAGQFDEAVKRQRQAIELAPADYRSTFERRLKLYEANKPYRALRGGEIR